MPMPNKTTEQTAALLADTAMRADCDIKWEEERVKRASAVRAKASVAAAAALAPSPSGRSVSLSGDVRAMPPPVKAVPFGKPPPPDLQSAPPIKAVPTSKPSPPSPSTLGPSPPGAQTAGGSTRGPDLGGALIPESTAGSVFNSYHVPVGQMGRSIQMRLAAASDRLLQTFPRGAFEYLPPTDPPILGVLGGVHGPG